MVAHRTLTPFVRVRILHPLPKKQSSHPGRLFFYASGKDSNNLIGYPWRGRAGFSSAKKTVRRTVFRCSAHTNTRIAERLRQGFLIAAHPYGNQSSQGKEKPSSVDSGGSLLSAVSPVSSVPSVGCEAAVLSGLASKEMVSSRVLPLR